METKQQAIIVDLDGTLSDCTHRRHFVTLSETRKKKDWKSFYAELVNDPVAPWCKDIVDALSKKYFTILVSGRPQEHEEVTRNWLFKYNINYHALFMRRVKDNRDDYIVKKEIYEEHIKPFYDICLVIDDRSRVVKMWREQGLICLQCAEGNY